MLKLAEDFYITSITKRVGNGLNLEKEYNFKYKAYHVELHVLFSIIAITSKSNIAIVNFGYSVDVKKWSDRHLRYIYIDGLDEQDGRSTKKYFDSKVAREIVVKILEKNVSDYLLHVKPCILIRGALSDIKVNLQRYKRFDKIFFENGYKKEEFDTKEYKSLHEATLNRNDEESKIIWAYAKNKNHLLELKNVYEVDRFF